MGCTKKRSPMASERPAALDHAAAIQSRDGASPRGSRIGRLALLRVLPFVCFECEVSDGCVVGVEQEHVVTHHGIAFVAPNGDDGIGNDAQDDPVSGRFAAHDHRASLRDVRPWTASCSGAPGRGVHQEERIVIMSLCHVDLMAAMLEREAQRSFPERSNGSTVVEHVKRQLVS